MEDPIQKAIKEVRARLGLNQVDFARRISRAINTVSRYESQVVPRGEALIPYAALAIRSQFDDLAEVLGAALIKDLGTDFEVVLAWLPKKGSAPHQPSDQDARIEAFRAFTTAKDLTPIEAIARKSLEEMLHYYYPKNRTDKSKKTA